MTTATTSSTLDLCVTCGNDYDVASEGSHEQCDDCYASSHCAACGIEYDGLGDGCDGHCPTCADRLDQDDS